MLFVSNKHSMVCVIWFWCMSSCGFLRRKLWKKVVSARRLFGGDPREQGFREEWDREGRKPIPGASASQLSEQMTGNTTLGFVQNKPQNYPTTGARNLFPNCIRHRLDCSWAAGKDVNSQQLGPDTHIREEGSGAQRKTSAIGVAYFCIPAPCNENESFLGVSSRRSYRAS